MRDVKATDSSGTWLLEILGIVLLVKGEETIAYPNDTWLKVKGRITTKEWHDWIIPMVLVQEV